MSEERRLVTVLFADVVGSTSLGESLDPEDLRRLLSRFYEIARQAVEEHGGTLEKFIGDAAMAIFGLPQAHDDDARRALGAALELCARMRSDPLLADRLPIRAGVNSGEVVASRDRVGGDFIITGDAVNVAARLQQAAEPWQILASVRTASAAAGAYEFGAPFELDLKGKRAAVGARVLIGPAAVQPTHTPLVGRDADLAQLELVARRSFGERRPYLVSLIAPAGTGKTRLVEEFLSRLPGVEPRARVASAQCLPYGQQLTYWPMRALLLAMIGLDGDEAAPDVVRSAAAAWLERVGAERPAEVAELLAATIGASDADVRDRTALLAAWRSAVELAASERPLVLLVEDLHWSSDSLLDLIEFIIQPRTDAPMLMLALSRPELLERRPSWGGGRRNYVSLALEPLDDAAIERLVGNLLEGPAPELLRIAADRSEGNPFYAGEIVRSLIERGIDLRDPDAVAEAARGLPDTVQATVLARLDLLEPGARRVLQLGAVHGRSFTPAGIAALQPDLEGDLGEAIEHLIDRDLLRQAPHGELVFRHILIREVAYGTLPRSERAALHGAAARWLEAGSGDRLDELAELIAYHYREAAVLGEASGLPDPLVRSSAVEWLRRAAEVAGGARGIAEASAHLRAAIELAEPDDLPEIYQRLGEMLGSGDRSAEAFATAWRLGLERGRPVDVLLGNLAGQLHVLCRWYASVAHQPTLHEMEALIERGRGWLPQAAPRTRAAFLIAASFLPFWIRNAAVRPLTEDDLVTARTEVAEGMAIAEELDDAEMMSAALDAMTSHRMVITPAEALELSRRRLALGERLWIDERLDALHMVAWTTSKLGDLEAMLEASRSALEIVQPGQNPGFALGGASWSAYGHALQGDWEALVASVEDLRRRWVAAERPAASFGLQGLLSGLDWARNRGEIERLERWRSAAAEIVSRFDPSHPVGALRPIIELDLPGIAAVVEQHGRYPDRTHYVEHALAICADHRQPVPRGVLDAIVDGARSNDERLLCAQALRLRGLLAREAGDLAEAAEIFEACTARRYASRARWEHGRLTGDAEEAADASRALEAMGELAALGRWATPRGGAGAA